MCKSCWDFGSYPDHRERNVYRVEDENETPYKKRGSGKKFCKRAKGKNAPHEYKVIHVYKMKYDYVEKVYKNMLVPQKVCKHCGKPEWRFYWL